MGENTRAESDILVKIALCESISTELELRWFSVCKVCIENPERVQLGDMMPTHLICANKELNLNHHNDIVSTRIELV